MGNFKNTVLPILVAGIWINISETARWLLVIKSYWTDHYQQLNLVFPNDPVHGIIWLIWGFLLAIVIFLLSEKFSLLQTSFISWIAVFVMLWIVLWNINILPVHILWYVIPLSFIEVFIAAFICKKLSPTNKH
jgi:hypothetical protein